MPSLRFGAISFCVAFLALLSGCSGSSPQQTTSGFPQRAFVSNSGGGSVQIIDSIHDILDFATSISAGTSPGLMALAPSRKFTLVFDSTGNSISVINNAQESQTAAISLPSWTESMTISPDSSLGYVAMPAAQVLAKPAGIVDVLDLVNNRVKNILQIPQAHWLAVNHSGNRVLVFSDNSDAVTVINPAQIGKGAFSTTVTGFDRPVGAVFSEDDSVAYVLNCGAECGGTSAGVTVLNMNTNTTGAAVGLSGATSAMLINGNLYVAGSGHGVGTLQVVNTAGLTASAPVSISNGYHWRMELGSRNKLFIGSRGCTNRGCLSIFDISSNQVVIDTPNGDVTGIAPIPNRNIVYVIEGGELRIFDTTTSAPSTTRFLDIVGKAIDVKEIDPAQ
ncbi:MAG TPA: YncE family protein [Terriglobales bacterium]|nr:YncE family protein [Terriglobales bacterium]